MKLPMANVDADHPRRAVAQQAVGEAAGGLAHVQAPAPGHGHARGLERTLELEPAARDVARLGGVEQLDFGICRQSIRLGQPAPAAGCAPARAGRNQALGLAATGGQAPFDKHLVGTHPNTMTNDK
jgi:hypothetical protein